MRISDWSSDVALPICFGVSGEWIYGIFSVAMLLTAFIGPTVGHRIDRFGGRGVLTASSLVFAGGLALLGAAPNLAVFALGRGVLALGLGMGFYGEVGSSAGKEG